MRYDSASGEPVYLNGRIGIAAILNDRSSPAPNILGVYRAELALDSTVVFSKRYDRITLDDNRYGALDYLSCERFGLHGAFSALFRREGNPIDFYHGEGVLIIPPAVPRTAHTLHITAADYSGNFATVDIPVVFGPRPVFTACAFSSGGKLRIAGDDSAGTLDRVEIRRFANDTWNLVESLPFEGRSWKQTFDLREKQPVCSVTLVSRDGARSLPSIVRNPPSVSSRNDDPRKLDVRVQLLHDCAAIIVAAPEYLTAYPRLVCSLNGGPELPVALVPKGEKSWIARVPLTKTGRCVLRTTVRASDAAHREIYGFARMDFHRIGPSDNSLVSAPGGRFSMRLAPNALFRAAPVSMDTVSTAIPAGLTPVSGIYRVVWGDEPMKGSFQAEFHLTSEPPPNALIFVSGNGESWYCSGGQKRGKLFSGTCKGSGFLGVFIDSREPSLEVMEPPPDSKDVSPRPELVVHVSDEESGIDRADAVNLFIDGRPVYGEYDPERKEIRYRVREDLAVGVHHAIAAALDRAGNRAVRNWDFTVR